MTTAAAKELELSSFASEFVVEICQLPQEAIVGPHFAVTSDLGQGFHCSHVLSEHQVGQDASA